jgi:hypothetical protein
MTEFNDECKKISLQFKEADKKQKEMIKSRK